MSARWYLILEWVRMAGKEASFQFMTEGVVREDGESEKDSTRSS